MLILEVRGVRVDLQYSQAPHIAEAWPEIIRRQPTDPAFALKFEALLKLKPARDLFYLLYSIPDLVQFRMAYQLIKEWAKIRGIYGARFGYLGGIHISVLLVRICKMLSHSGNNMTATSVITTFFDHYATFNWQTQVAFDPFFHKQLRYDRSFREPLCIIGWHSPVLNTSSAASRPTVKTLERELQRARDRMLTHGMTWSKFLGGDDPCNDGFSVGAQDFLKTYKSYIKMDLHYWGSSLEDGCRLVGWLESRCVSILVDIGMQLPGLVARIWPQRFTESHTESFSTSRHYHGLYLIGLDWDEVNGLFSGICGACSPFEVQDRFF
ncbi:hypothetical protein HYQ45_015071 [Verticillium longisporum]|uniref:polynucleotide adenylyltransferase n=1 Tax=Verticillium longisporum TaxID=100787 RepID=A0A8I3AHZ4_VERLO|nr:hypothetical protein HYQ45_015071 [Verticillium longisporum]